MRMTDDIVDPYERILRLESEIVDLWQVNHQLVNHVQELAIQVKDMSELGVQVSSNMNEIARGIEHMYNMLKNVEFRTQVLEIKQNEKTISRPLR